jgi:opacity protein-like surface antigen
MERQLKLLAVVTLVLTALILVAQPARAEWFADLYVGGAFTQSHNVDTKLLGVTLSFKDVEFDKSFAVGGRAGYWFDALPFLGLGLDVSHFRPDISSQTAPFSIQGVTGTATLSDIDLRVIGISLDLMLRLPLVKSADFPNGRLQPYASVGPAIFISKAEDTTNFAPPANQSDTDTSVGFKVGAGVTFLFTKNIGIFGEYRYTHFSPEFEFTTAGVKSKTETDINTHHLLVGASFRF